MSSPYQSRLFNYLNRQSIRLSAQSARVWRQIEMTTIWGAQILLYPAYLLVQAGRLAIAQATKMGRKVLSPLPASKLSEPSLPPAEQPIRQVLAEIDSWQLEAQAVNLLPSLGGYSGKKPALTGDLKFWIVTCLSTVTESAPVTVAALPGGEELTARESNPSLKCALVVQGVASLLSSRTLVLVTAENEILDILTPEQQRRLQQRLIWELADYWRQWRLIQVAQQGIVGKLKLPKERSHLWLPIRLFWQGMAWMQGSTVVIAANLFQESTMTRRQLASATVAPLDAENLSQISALILDQLAFLDCTVAELEKRQLNVGEELSHRTQEILQQWQNQFGWVSSADSAETPAVGSGEKIRALIARAINYFFGNRQQPLPGEENPLVDRVQLSGDGIGDRLPVLPGSSPMSVATTATGEITPHTAQLPSSTPETNITQPASFNIPGLIQRAIEYFTRKRNQTLANSTEAVLPASNLTDIPESSLNQPSVTLPPAKPWLSWERLFGSFKPPQETPGISNRALLAPASTPNLPENSFYSAVSRAASSSPSSKKTALPSRKFPKKKRSPAKVPAALAALPPTPKTAIIQPAIAANHFSEELDSIETPATSVGYVKHPLEKILSWLDRLMLWLEEIILLIWRWLKRIGNQE